MDIVAHSLWSMVLLPGPPSVAKVIFGIAPDAAVFATSLTVQAFKGKMQPGFKTRQEMMEWYDRKENRWIVNLYKMDSFPDNLGTVAHSAFYLLFFLPKSGSLVSACSSNPYSHGYPNS